MKLYYTPGACSLAPHIVLEELAIEHTLEKVDLRSKKTANGEDFISINNKGYVPALVLDSGTMLTEGSIISLYLADLKPEAALVPSDGEARYQLLSLMTFISTELHKPMGAMFNPELNADTKAANVLQIARRLDWIVDEMQGKEFVFGKTMTIADAYLFTVLSWHKMVNFDLSKWPSLQHYLAQIVQRPAVQKAMQAEGLI